MSEWVEKSLGAVAEILDSFRVPVNDEVRQANPGTTPYFGANGLQGYIDGWIFDEPLILMAEDGGYFDEFQVRPIAYKISGKSWVNNHAHVLKPKNEINFNYLFFSLQHKNITPFIKGGTRAKLNRGELTEIPIRFPKDPTHQKKIAAILETVDEAIGQTEALIAKYEQIKAGMMQDLFTRGLTPKGKLRPPRHQAPDQYKQTPIGWIPKEWEVKAIGKLLDAIEQGWSPDCASEPAAEDEWGVLKTTSVTWTGFSTIENKKLPVGLKPKLNYQIRMGDLLMTRAGPNSRVGVVAYVENEPSRVLLSDKLYRLKPKQVLDSQFLTLALSSENTQRHLDAFKTGLAESQTNISQAIVRKLLVAYPDAIERQEIVVRLKSADEQIQNQLRSLLKLQQQKSGLMHDLLTGKVAVKV
jgi:type I restriction enzyme, S subunit